VNTCSDLCVSVMFPNSSSVTRPLPSLLAGSDGTPSPVFWRYYAAATTAVAARPALRFSGVAPDGLELTSLVRSPGPGSPRPRRLDVVHRFHPLRPWSQGDHGSPKFPANSSDLCPALGPRPAPCARSLRRSGVAPVIATAKAPTSYDFRGSITRLQSSLFTLRAVLTDDYAKLASGG
jgi:hypothetical protein